MGVGFIGLVLGHNWRGEGVRGSGRGVGITGGDSSRKRDGGSSEGARWEARSRGREGGGGDGNGGDGGGVGLEDVRGRGGGDLARAAGMGGAVVSQPPAVQGVRREERPGADSLLRRLRLFLQPPSARAPRDRPFHPLERVSPMTLSYLHAFLQMPLSGSEMLLAYL